jgi:hypothetical protein
MTICPLRSNSAGAFASTSRSSLGAPGEFPYTGGVYRGRLWTMRRIAARHVPRFISGYHASISFRKPDSAGPSAGGFGVKSQNVAQQRTGSDEDLQCGGGDGAATVIGMFRLGRLAGVIVSKTSKSH